MLYIACSPTRVLYLPPQCLYLPANSALFCLIQPQYCICQPVLPVGRFVVAFADKVNMNTRQLLQSSHRKARPVKAGPRAWRPHTHGTIMNLIYGTNYIVPNTVQVHTLYVRYLRDEIPLVGFACDVICGRIQQLWPAQKLFSVFVEVSGYQNGLAFIWYRL